MKPYAPRSTNGYHPDSQILRPVFGIDIDGTLGAYHQHFLDFASDWLGMSLPYADEYDGTVSLASFMGISKQRYRKIKLAYRRGGMKRSMPPFHYARNITRNLRDRGAIVVLCTTRPYLSMENIDEDTRHWTRRNKVQHDHIIWGEHKYRDLVQMYGQQRIVCVLEDMPSLIQQAYDLNLFSLVMDAPYNRPPVLSGPAVGFLRVPDLWEAEYEMLDLLDVWERENR